MKRIRRSLGVLVAVVGLSACGTEEPKQVSAAAQTQAPDDKVAASPQWASEGDRLRQEKRSAWESRTATDSPLPGNSVDVAFRTHPIDITGNGAYTLRANVPPTFDYPNSPKVVSINYPPDNEFTVQPDGMKVATIDGQRQVEVRIIVTNFKASYKGYSVWLY